MFIWVYWVKYWVYVYMGILGKVLGICLPPFDFHVVIALPLAGMLFLLIQLFRPFSFIISGIPLAFVICRSIFHTDELC